MPKPESPDRDAESDTLAPFKELTQRLFKVPPEPIRAVEKAEKDDKGAIRKKARAKG